MSSAQRKYESGAQKRKCQQQKQERALELLKKTPKLTSFFQSQPAAATASRPTREIDHEWKLSLQIRQSPTITFPDAIMAYADASQTSTKVTWDQPTGTDNSNEVLTAKQVAGLPSESNFGRGSHFIKYKASDSAHNTDVGTFSVIVQGEFKFSSQL